MRSLLKTKHLGCILIPGVCILAFVAIRYYLDLRILRSFDYPMGTMLHSNNELESSDVDEITPINQGDFSEFSDGRCYQVDPLTCVFDNQVRPGCYLINGVEALVPLSFVTKKYETYGSVQRASGTLYIHHANVEVPLDSESSHQATGRFMFFDNYHVESRSRVKLIIADEGVPISRQWSSRGYKYAIQIAQFGLSHYTKLVETRRQVLVNRTTSDRFSLLDLDVKQSVGNSSLIRVEGLTSWRRKQDGSLRFYAENADAVPSGLTLHLLTNLTWRYFVLLGQQWHEGTTVTVTVRLSWPTAAASDGGGGYRRATGRLDSKKSYSLVYACKRAPPKHEDPYLSVDVKELTATFWMPQCANNSDTNVTQSRVNLARDLLMDLLKAFGAEQLNFHGPATDLSKRRVYVHSIRLSAGAAGFEGGGLVSELRLGIPNTELSGHERNARNQMTEMLFHEVRFLAASSWFLRNQQPDGTWITSVPRTVHGRLPIEPGWPSAMAQGHGISVLVRAYNHTGDETYLHAARNALPAYNRTVAEHGVRNLFLNLPSFPWYEEYPTEPGLFVLNGFIYSLIGLYDLDQLEQQLDPTSQSDAKPLLEAGLTSLSALLPLFDSGTGSFYDLGHVMQPSPEQPVVPRVPRATGANAHGTVNSGPNRARWDYHVVHIRQLRILATLDNPVRAQQWLSTADRWTAYMIGLRSPHN